MIIGAATLGLPDALAYVVARRPDLGRAAVRRGLLLSCASGALAATIGVLAGPALAAGDMKLSVLIAFAAVMAVPALMVGILRGAAGGRQRWDLVAWERGLNTALRLLALVLLALTGHLTVLTALLVSTIGPIVAGIVYRGIGKGSAAAVVEDLEALRLSRTLLLFGSKVWLGGVATILVARVAQLVIVPFSGVSQLGLYIVAVTISDVPWIVVQAVRDVVFGSSAAERNDARMLATSRAATVIAALNSLALGFTLPWWLTPLFGPGFEDAKNTTWVLLASSVVAVPGLVAGAAVAAAGRPGARSAALVCGVVVNVVALFMLVPDHGALGAGVANLLCTATMTIGCLIASRFVVGAPTSHYLLPTTADVRLLLAGIRRLPYRSRGTAPESEDAQMPSSSAPNGRFLC